MKKNWYCLLMTLGVGCCSLAFNNVSTNVNPDKFVINSKNVLSANNENNSTLFDEGSEIADNSLSVKVTSVSKTETSTSLTLVFDCDTSFNKDYYVGYYNKTNYLPAVVQCTLKDGKGNTLTSQAEMSRVNSLVEYNGIGPDLGQTSFTTYCDFTHGADYSLDLSSSIKVLNVLEYDFDTKTLDTTNKYNIDVQRVSTDAETGKETKLYSEYNISDFISFSYAGRSILSGFTSFKVDVDTTAKEVDGEGYKKLGSSYKRLYTNNEAAIESGSMYVRSRFGFSGDSYYKITYKDGTEQNVSDISNFVNVTQKGSSLYFLLNGINGDEVSNIQVVGGVIALGIYNTSTYKEVSRTNAQIRFGYMNFLIDDIKNQDGSIAIKKNENTYNVNSNLLIGLSVALVSLAYIAVSLVLFFVWSKKYKDDEFKRVNPKLYWKTNILGLLTVDCVLLFVEFVAVRVNLISNSLPIFNPCDAFIAAFGVASLLLVGYFIRYFYILFKAKYEKRRNEKLKMNTNVIDDGTLIINK